MKKIIFVIFFIPFCLFSNMPRLFIFLDCDSDFTKEELQYRYDCIVVSGDSVQIKEKIAAIDTVFLNQLIIIDGHIDDLDAFSRKLGYDYIFLKKNYREAAHELEERLASLPLTEKDLPVTDPYVIGEFYKLLDQVKDVFEQNDLFYWAYYGTLLGAIRHQGMIPWDDDIDLAVFFEDAQKLNGMKADFEKIGIELLYVEKIGIFKIFYKNGSKIDDEDCSWAYPCIDIFPMRELDGKIFYQHPFTGFMKRNDYINKKDLSKPLEKVKFGPLYIPVPYSPSDILDRTYGCDWNEIAYVEYDHKIEKKRKKIKVVLTERKPADYILP